MRDDPGDLRTGTEQRQGIPDLVVEPERAAQLQLLGHDATEIHGVSPDEMPTCVTMPPRRTAMMAAFVAAATPAHSTATSKPSSGSSSSDP
jgi:hypothetical protein